jgi:hypothetical protein
MKQFRWMVMGGALAMTLGFVLALSAPAGAQQPGGAPSPEIEPPPPVSRGPSAQYIDWQLGRAVVQLNRALTIQTNGTTPDPERTSKLIYEAYVKVRSAHALLVRRKDKLESKTGIPDPLLGMAYTTIRKARFSVLYARQAAAKSQTEKSVDHLTTALADLERARAMIN